MKLLRHYLLCVAIGTQFAASPALAVAEDDFLLKDGSALLAVCGEFVATMDRGGRNISDKEFTSMMACRSYTRGFSHGVAVMSKEPEQGNGYCVDPSVSGGQIARVVVKYLRENPQILHFHPGALLDRALREGFPCK